MNENVVDDQLRKDWQREPKELKNQRGQKDFCKDCSMWFQQRKESAASCFRFFNPFYLRGWSQQQEIPCPVFFKLSTREFADADCGITQYHSISFHLIDHDKVKSLPVCNCR